MTRSARGVAASGAAMLAGVWSGRAEADCHPNARVLDAGYIDGACVTDDMTDACAAMDWTDHCPTWSELAWTAVWARPLYHGSAIECLAGSQIAHRHEDYGGGATTVTDFGWDGSVVGVRHFAHESAGYCCDGHGTYEYIQGDYGGLCIEGDDPLDALPPVGDGCSAVPTRARCWSFAIGAVAILLAARRRPGGASPRSRQEIVTTTAATRRT